MKDIVLTKDSDYLICKIYEAYLLQIKNGDSPTEASRLSGVSDIQKNLIPQWAEEKVCSICGQLDRKGLIKCFYADNTVYDAHLTDDGIIYMENRFSNNMKKLANWILKVAPFVF